MFYAVWDFFNSKQKVKQYKHSNLPKSYKTEIKILANPGLAYQASKQPTQKFTFSQESCTAKQQMKVTNLG